MTTIFAPLPRWTILFDAFHGPQRTAVIEAQRGIQYYLPYVVNIQLAAKSDLSTLEHVLIIGKADSCPALAEVLSQRKLTPSKIPGSFVVHIGSNSLKTDTRLIAIHGADDAGVLHGVAEFLAILSKGGVALDLPGARRARIDGMFDQTVVSSPAIAERGLWTWGYVIYDYRGYLDQMVRLKLNTLTMWNDVVPVNMAEILTYAHDRGIKVHAGFHWGWGIPDLDLSKSEHRQQIHDSVIKTYLEQYADLAIDGLYFQTITEHHGQELAGRSVAAWCCDLINPIARDLWAMRPGMPIQFGLHASSIGEHYTDLEPLDPRITITWEDAGVLPFSINPQPDNHGLGLKLDCLSTLDYAKRLAKWRPASRFAMVPKGWLMLRWGVEFEHHGPFICGERQGEFICDRLQARQSEWAWKNQLWFQHFPLAAHFYRELVANSPGGMLVTALVEDALLEARIQPSVALFADMLWNPHQTDAELMARALLPYVGGV